MTPCETAGPRGASWEALGTGVVLRVTDPTALTRARCAVEEELEAIDAACSRFRSDSELSRVNDRPGRATKVGPVLIEAVETALQAAEATEGDVDPTLGRALELAGYNQDWAMLDHTEEAVASPAPAAVTARVLSGYTTVVVDRERSTIRIAAGTKLDLGATAKAWAADRAAAQAAAAGDCGALVGVGGDIATAGPAPAKGWDIRVTDDHRSDASAPGQTISISSGGLATSSTTVRRWRHRGEARHHIFDPRTGAPVLDTWRTVTVAAASCAEANAACTAAIVRAAAAPAWLEQLGLPARLVELDGSVTAVAGWPQEPSQG
jgi:thiamine biosynthesis lipoprotein